MPKATNYQFVPLVVQPRWDQTDGYVELVSDGDDGTLLGATIVAPHASELIAEICIAIEMGASIEDVALTIHPHPTLSELVMDVAKLPF